MGKQVAQGTAHESHIRNQARAIGRVARRLAKTGVAHEPDVEIEGQVKRPAVFWKQYTQAGSRRKTTSMVVILEQDFWRLVEMDREASMGWLIQAKATQKLGVRATLLGLLGWMQR